MKNDAFFKIIMCVAAAFTIISSVLNWDYFFNNRRARIFVKLFGRTGARIFYVLIGIGFLFITLKV